MMSGEHEDFAAIARQVLRGECEYVSVPSGHSQYTTGGSAACGLAALNCARLVLQREKSEKLAAAELLKRMMEKEMCDDILQICLQWPGTMHLDVDEILSAPIFDRTLTGVWSEFQRPGYEQFQALLNRVEQSSETSAALVITRPPEIITVLKIVTGTRSAPVFVTFDSHPRHTHPNGAAFIFHPSLDVAASYLGELMQYDPDLLEDTDLQWQVQLLAHYSAHLFIAKDIDYTDPFYYVASSVDVEESLLDRSSPAFEPQTGSADPWSDHDGTDTMRPAAGVSSRTVPIIYPSTSSFAGAALFNMEPSPPSPPTSDDTDGSTIPRPVYQTLSPSKGKHNGKATDEGDELFALRVQQEWQEDEVDRDHNTMLFALKQQEWYDQEDKQLLAQLQELQYTDQKTFECGVCMEILPEDDVARIEPCGHNFCRPCMRQYLQSKLTEHRFPILCPTCAVGQANRGGSADRGDPGIISGFLAEQLGLSEEEYALYIELELASFSVLLHCRRCDQTSFVDKAEFDAENVISCPLPGCAYSWCKTCSQAVELTGPPHSCDGALELTHLMNQQGWKHCPGCRTPTSKTEGCNHMTCITPGCNMHFCYSCGGVIVQSVLQDEIRNGINAHYANCR